MTEGTVSIPLADGEECEALISRPDAEGRFPAVLVLHDVLGFTDDLARICRRFSDSGFVALAPNLFGPGRKPVCIVKTMRALAAGEGRPFAVMSKAQDWLADQPDVHERRLGAVGFCLGGGFAVLHATRAPLAFVGAFYGEVPKHAEELRQMPPCFGGYGDRDLMFRGHGRRLKSHLDELGIANDVRIYDDVGHSYMNQLGGVLGKAAAYTPMRARYDESAAEDSWNAMLEFFDLHLAGVTDE